MAEDYIDRIEIDGVERPIRDSASGFMSAADYDADSAVKTAGGIAAYVAANGVADADKAAWDKAVLLENVAVALPISGIWSSVCYGSGKFVAVMDGSISAAYSTDGVSWVQTAMPSDQDWKSVCYGGGKFVAVASDSTVAAYSTDGITWTQTTLPDDNNWRSVCYGSGKFVAVCYFSDVAAYSADGITWTQTTLPYDGNWLSVCYGGGKFVAVAFGTPHGAYSADGISWVKTTRSDAPPITMGPVSVCFGNGKFVAVNEYGYHLYSDDGITWALGKKSSLNNWVSGCFGGGKFIAIKSGGGIAAYSADGITWTETTLPSASNWSSVCYGSGRFVAVAYNGTAVAYSADGITWHSGVKRLTDKDGTDIHEDVRDALEIEKPAATLVTLSAAGWDAAAKTQTVTVSGVLADEGAQRIAVAPNMAGMSAYRSAGVWCSAQAADSLTFSCDTVPTADIAVYVTVEGVRSA